METKRRKTLAVAFVGGIIVMMILVVGTIFMGQRARNNTEQAVRSVSLLYLDELAGRREQVVSKNLSDRITDLDTALQLMTEEDLQDKTHLEAYQTEMKKLFKLERFAFVDESGMIYTSTGMQNDIGQYGFDYQTITEPEISIKNLDSAEKKVIIAMPADQTLLSTQKRLVMVFMEIDMNEMLSGVSMENQDNKTTFSNLYTNTGIALSNTILGGLAVEDDLLEALGHAVYEKGYSYDQVKNDFAEGRRGVVSFVYEGIQETLSYVPVKGTDWMLTYLIRESVITNQIGAISEDIINSSILQSALTVIALLSIFLILFAQTKRNTQLQIDMEKADAANQAKQEELEEKTRLQEQLMEQQQILSDALDAAEQANKAKTAFLSSMSHEIRTPMNAIIGLDNIAMNDPETPEKIKGYLGKIGSSAEHLLNLINDILDMSRIESGHMVLRNEEFSFSKLLETINMLISGQCADKGLEYHCHIQGQVDDYYIGDNMKLRQVLINILGNAVKFTPQGGRVVLEVDKTAEMENQSTLQFRISDTGIGSSKEFLPKLFESFSQEDSSTTSKYGSSGLGLAITKHIVEMMNGTIEVESEKDKGSVFTVTVTLMNSSRCDQEEEIEEIHPSDLSVLVVDDDPIACAHAKLVLENAGISAETAASGQEAIRMAQLRHVRRDPYNLILVDWKMPEMDGVETARRLREIIGRESAIIILTAYRWDDVLDEALAAGVDSFVAKPLFAGAVLEEFREAWKKKAPAAKNASIEADLTGRRVLLAEDVQVNAEIMLMLLDSWQMKADLAHDGAEALKLYQEHPAGYYDAILMDMRMPVMDGLEASRQIRASQKEDAAGIPIIALTANAFDEDVQRSMQAGLNAHLSKPIQPELLSKTLKSLIKA